MKLFKTKDGYLTLVKGRPSTGKSIAALIDAYENVRDKNNAIFFSFEMYQWLVNERINKIIKPNKNERGKVSIIDLMDISVELICQIAKENKPNLIYIDYLDLLQSNKYAWKECYSSCEKRKEKQAYIIETLTQLAIDMNIKVIVIAQQARDYEIKHDFEVVKNSFKEIFEKINNSNYVIPMFIKRDLNLAFFKNENKNESFNEEPNEVLELVDDEFIKYSEFNVRDLFRDFNKD